MPSVNLQVTAATANNRAARSHHDTRPSAGDANSPFASMLDNQTSGTDQPSRTDATPQQQSDASARTDAPQRPDRADRPKRTKSNDV